MPQPVRDEYRIEALGKELNRKTFSCGIEALDRYLREQINQDAKKRVATPFALIRPPEKTVIGYFTLASGSVDLGEWPEALAKKLPRYPLIPVTLLGRLALDKSYRGKGLGEHLLMDALYRSLIATEQIASVAVIVDAINDEAKEFYEHYGFIVFPNHTHRLFIHMQTISEMF
ncbi:MAG: GNAT family N-acetyltransferase [Nitrospiria bacterium]